MPRISIGSDLLVGPGRPEIFAHSAAMRTVMAAVRAAAATRRGVLVCGEHGSGRRLIAHELHFLSKGEGAPFVAVDCAELEELESVLFGIPPLPGNGDAAKSKLDRISTLSVLHQAVGGTLFLAHLPEMPARVQARLARLLRDGEVSVMESRLTVPTRVRLVASADDGWDTAVAEGQIRGDLSKRCSATRINLPPLRERHEDIPALATLILGEVCNEAACELRTIEPSALSLLCAFPWRGNARELRQLLQTIVSRSSQAALGLEDVLAAVHLDGTARTFLGSGTLREAKERFERDYIREVLERHRGRIGDAARALGIQRPNLYRKMRDLRLSPPRQGQVQA